MSYTAEMRYVLTKLALNLLAVSAGIALIGWLWGGYAAAIGGCIAGAGLLAGFLSDS